MTYHVNITQFLFSHTIAEVLDGPAFTAPTNRAVKAGVVRLSNREPESSPAAVTR